MRTPSGLATSHLPAAPSPTLGLGNQSPNGMAWDQALVTAPGGRRREQGGHQPQVSAPLLHPLPGLTAG